MPSTRPIDKGLSASPPDRLGGGMTERRIRVDRVTDPARYAATDELVWFGPPSPAPVERQLTGLRPEHRWAASVEGDGAAEPAGSYAGIYGVFPLTLSVPGPDAGLRQLP